MLYIPQNSEKIRHTCISKHNSTRKNQVNLLMIRDGEKWHYLAAEKLSVLFKRMTSNHKSDYNCLNCLHSFKTKKKLKNHENICKNHEYCT